jgi:hypothetical protein
MATDVGIGLFQCVDETECDRRGTLVEVIGDCVVDV